MSEISFLWVKNWPKEDDFRPQKWGPLNYFWYYTHLEIIIHNLSTHQYGNQSQQVKTLPYFMRKEKKFSLWRGSEKIFAFFKKMQKVENLNYTKVKLSNWRIWRWLTLNWKWWPMVPDIRVSYMYKIKYLNFSFFAVS